MVCYYDYYLRKIPWNPSKTIEGSLAFIFFSFSGCLALFSLFHSWTTISLDVFIFRIAILSVVGSLIETFPVKEIDNITVFCGVAFVAYILEW
jgi:dolichol kinase